MRAALATWAPRAASWLFDSALWRLPPPARTSRVLSLTFDDGPSSAGTWDLLRVLDRFHVPATFFVVGRHAQIRPHLVRNIVAAGHCLGNHSWSHADAWRTSRLRTAIEFSRTRRFLEDLSGDAVPWMRPPYGHLTLPMVQWCRRHRQRMVLWDAAPPDYQPYQTIERLQRHWVAAVRPGSIVLLHDNPQSAELTPRLLKSLLPDLLRDGWRFEPLPRSAAWRPHEPRRAAAS